MSTGGLLNLTRRRKDDDDGGDDDDDDDACMAECPPPDFDRLTRSRRRGNPGAGTGTCCS